MNQSLAEAFHVSFANPYNALVRRELATTYVLDDGNIHPNDEGYLVIAGAIEAVPEPSTFVLMAIGLAGLAVAAQTRSRNDLWITQR